MKHIKTQEVVVVNSFYWYKVIYEKKRRWIAELKRERQKRERERDKMMKGTLMNVPEHFHADQQALDCPMFLYSPVHPAMQHLPYLSIVFFMDFGWIYAHGENTWYHNALFQFICIIHICISDRHTRVEFIKFYCKKFICCTQCISESQNEIFFIVASKRRRKK